jgi:hypothetical protein
VAVRAAAPAKKMVLLLVVSPKRSEADLPLADVKNIFLGKKTHWDSGDTIYPVLPPKKAADLGSVFYKHVVATEPDEFDKLWKGRVARGASAAVPEQFSDMKETLRALKNTGAVMLIPAVDADRFRQYMKVLTIDGKKPADEGYPLVFEP